MNHTYQVNQDWQNHAKRIVKPQQIVLVIGATDAGKSTFCRFLVDSALAQGFKTLSWIQTSGNPNRVPYNTRDEVFCTRKRNPITLR